MGMIFTAAISADANLTPNQIDQFEATFWGKAMSDENKPEPTSWNPTEFLETQEVPTYPGFFWHSKIGGRRWVNDLPYDKQVLLPPIMRGWR